MRVPLVDLAAQEATVAEDALAAVAQVARTARFVLGPTVEAFERWIAGTCGVAHAVGVACGTDAIELALRALGIGPGDAVITPAFSFVAAAEAIAQTGARPVFCDVEDETLVASGRTVAAAVHRARAAGWRVRALVPVHLFGWCAPAGELFALASREGIHVVEDAAQAIGATDDAGRPAGGSGVAGCFSFFPTKNLGAWGDAGAVVTRDGALADRIRRLRAHGMTAPYVHGELGRNSRMDALQAAVLLAKSPRLADWTSARRRLAARYRERLTALPLRLPPSPTSSGLAQPAWHAYVVRTERRDELAAWLASQGVEARAYYPVPLHRQACFAYLEEPPLPVCEDASRTALAIPFHATMSDAQQDWVVAQVSRFFGAGQSG